MKEEDFTNKDWPERIEDIKNNLYLGGGKGQADSLIATMLSPYGKNFGQSDIDVHTTLASISAQIRSLKQTVLSGGIVPIKIFENSFKRTIQNHMPYACLDNDLKLAFAICSNIFLLSSLSISTYMFSHICIQQLHLIYHLDMIILLFLIFNFFILYLNFYK